MLSFIRGIFLVNVAICDSLAANANESEELIYLESTFVGDKQQPSVSHFIAWGKTPSAKGLRWNYEPKPNDDTLDVVDRDVMLRSIDVIKA